MHNVSPFVRGQLVKMIKTLEPHGICSLNFAYECMSTNNYLTTGMYNSLFDGRGFAEHHFRRVWSVSENAHNS